VLSSLSGHLFSFFSFAGAQCREQQRLPAKFTEFMDGSELREVVLHESSGGGPPYELEVYYDGNSDAFFRGAGTVMRKIMRFTKGGFGCLTITAGLRNSV
jgi:hypothetical protein